MASQAPVIDEAAAEETLLRWRNDPVTYAKERLGVKLLAPHEEVMLRLLPASILDRKPLVVPSAHAMGKDFTIDGIGSLWFAECFGPCKVIMTGPTDRQVKEIMWSELERSYNNRTIKDNFGRLISCKLDLAEDWFVLAFTTKETGEGAGKFQGLHSPRVMIIVSEAQKVDEQIYDQIDGLTTSGTVLQVYLGNPTRSTGRFAKMVRNTTDNRVIHLDAYQSPNVISGFEQIQGMVSKAWVEDKEKRWNADRTGNDPRYRSKVRGLLPLSSLNTVISEDLYCKCINKTIIQGVSRGVISVDPARFGDDDMVISVFESGRLIDEKVIPKCDAVVGAGEVVIMQKKHFPQGQIAIVFDCDGLGGPFLDIAKKMLPDNLDIVWLEYKGSNTKRDEIDPQYQNMRAQAHFFAKEQMEAGLVCLDENEEAKEDMTEAEYFVNLHGKIQIEEKEDIKERLGRSPGRGDARVMGIWAHQFAPVIKAKDMYTRQRQSSMVPNCSSAMGA